MSINLRGGRPRNRWQLMLVFFFALLAFVVGTLAWTASQTVTFADPPERIGDGVVYDNIAFCLIKGRGYSFDFRDPHWRKKYRQANADSQIEEKLDWVFNLQDRDRGPTASKPPGYPVVLAVIYRVCGHRWDAVRIFDCVFLSLGLATLITWAWTRWGALAAITAIITLLLDIGVMNFAGQILSEPIATSLMCIWFVILVRAVQRASLANWIVAGVLFALMVYVRSNWTLWLLALIAASPLLFFSRARQFLLPVKPHHVFAFLLTCVVLIAPWWVRNCVVIGHFQPLGTSGSNGLIAANCDESLADHGNWQSQVYVRHIRLISRQIDRSQLTQVHWEYEFGRYSTAQAEEWMMRNWKSLPLLAVYRLMTNWGLYQDLPAYLRFGNIWLLCLGVVGVFLTRGRVRFLLLLILGLDSLVVMATWAHYGRYFVPIRPLLHICYGLAAVTLLEWFARTAFKFRSQSK